MAKYCFVIPVYNVKDYLDECVSSILNQTYSDYEIILVDDGSTDGSSDLCDTYADKYPMVRVIHQKNQGLSAARNAGLSVSAGEYIIFLDSDDFWCDIDGLARIDEKCKEVPDVVYFASYNMEDETKKMVPDRYEYPESFNELDRVEALKEMVGNDLFNMSACKKAYRREFLTKNNLLFKVGQKCEDIDFNMRVANCLPICKFSPQHLYVYRHRSGSITHTIDDRHLQNYYDIVKTFAEYEYCNEETKASLLSYMAYQHALLAAYCTNVRSEVAKKTLLKLKKYIYLYDYDVYPRTKKIAILIKLCGFGITRRILGVYLKH
ncbi:MAG: glycosyltransferase [Clostridia bacterium]|nr:glycosyltransferase [Clostridia bacterium]